MYNTKFVKKGSFPNIAEKIKSVDYVFKINN